MTTVGYGDVYPTTWVGQLIATLVMYTGIMMVAMPITIVGQVGSTTQVALGRTRAVICVQCTGRTVSNEM